MKKMELDNKISFLVIAKILLILIATLALISFVYLAIAYPLTSIKFLVPILILAILILVLLIVIKVTE